MAATGGGFLVPGTRVDKYEVVHRIAFGGMAEIYLARVVGIQGFEKYVVLKRILPQYASNAEFVRMFLQEARVAASLDHANIAHVYDIGEIGGNYFFTMEYLHGEDLRLIMREMHLRECRLPLEHALEIVIGAASGLHFAHDKRGGDGRSLGIVHRDVSPANVVVTYDGGVKVVDFGIAKMTADPEFSRGESLKGKLAYMSPEQLQSQPVDRRSDVFALGILLYEITTHERLFRGANEIETMRVVLAGVVPPPSERVPGYPPALEGIVLRALEMDPGKRYQSARELQLDLEAFAREGKLHVSSAALAEWMEGTFGPKRELWHTLSLPEGEALGKPPGWSADKEPTAVTRMVERADADQPAPGAVDRSVPIEVSGPPRGRRRSWTARPLALVFAVAAGVGLWSARGSLIAGLRGSEPRPAAPTSVLLVAEQGSVAVERDAIPATPAPAAPEMPTYVAAAPRASEPAPASPAPAAVGETGPRRASARPRAPSGSSGANGFSAIFARREGDIRQCFVGHTGDAAGATQISLRFEIGRDGRVGAVSALPDAVGASPLGACLVRIARGTVFAPQPAPVTIRIPLTVQLQAGAGRHP